MINLSDHWPWANWILQESFSWSSKRDPTDSEFNWSSFLDIFFRKNTAFGKRLQQLQFWKSYHLTYVNASA